MGVPDRQVTVASYEGTDSFTVMICPGFKPGTFCVAAGSSNHYTAWSVNDLYKIYMIKFAETF